jgi:hypothetical protein
MNPVTRLSMLLCLCLAVFLAAGVPVLDEESYLAITKNLDILRPYNWWRPWPPWFGGTEPDAFVYAHPPLFLAWVAVVQDLTDGLRPTRLLACFPPAALLGWSAGRLITGMSDRPRLGLAVWLSSPIVVLGLQRGLMPDLLVAAFSTTAVMGWRERKVPTMAIVGGLALGLAAFTKYPALALVPVFLVHGFKVGHHRNARWFWLAAASIWVFGELYLYSVYGRFHLFEVLTRASEISRGTGEGRALALVVRLSLGVTVFGFVVAGARWVWIPAFFGAGLAMIWGWPQDVVLSARLAVGVFAVAGCVGVAVVLRALVAHWSKPDDSLLMALWAASVLGGVWAVHNFAAPRYMLTAVLPMALLVVSSVSARPQARVALWIGVGVQLFAALMLTITEHRFFEAGADLARAAVVQFHPTHFTGEWSFRHEMAGAGVRFFTGDAASGSIIVAPIHSSPGALPAGLVEIGRISADEAFGPRVLNESLQIGLYAETLGALPMGWSDAPIEEVIAWQVP